jgi:hypothetical protein
MKYNINLVGYEAVLICLWLWLFPGVSDVHSNQFRQQKRQETHTEDREREPPSPYNRI